MKKIITYGTFDLLHIGHIRLLSRARDLGEYLIVGLSTDDFNEKKHKTAFYPYDQRAEILRAIRFVDLVIPEKSWEQKIADIKQYNVDIFVIGDDWQGHFDFLKDICEVIYLPRTRNISTTIVKESLSNGGKNIEEQSDLYNEK
jgi:glycerol-3-phosphate cytidylyltransferase